MTVKEQGGEESLKGLIVNEVKQKHVELHTRRKQANRPNWFIMSYCRQSQLSTGQLLVHPLPATGFASKDSIKYIIKILFH